jgi:hypothetical protein
MSYPKELEMRIPCERLQTLTAEDKLRQKAGYYLLLTLK